jgi:hypothetical protein
MPMILEQRYEWGRAYRHGQLVCARVRVTIGRDPRLGLTPRERRYVTARFDERVDRSLRDELAALVRRRGAAARRVADRLDAIEIVVDDPHRGRERLVGCLQPPEVRRGDLHEIEFTVREPAP